MDFLKETDLWIENWKWALILFTAVLSPVIVVGFRTALRKLKNTLINHQMNDFWRALLNQKFETVIAWILVTVFWHAMLSAVSLPAKPDRFLDILVQLIQAFLYIAMAYQLADAVGEALQKWAARTENTLDDQLVPLARKTMKIFVVVFGALVALQGFGFNVVSILAGLGIGGLAIAFAAQDTVANVFGSITILLDQPFQVGDNIKVGDTEGIVEEIGFRSTRLRTPYNSLITIPNSVVAKEKIDNLGKRAFVRFRHIIGVTYDTTPEKLASFMDAIKNQLHKHEPIKKDDIRVYFSGLGDFSLQILVQVFIRPLSVHEQLQLEESILLEIMQIAEKLDVSFAFPTQTLQIQNMNPAPSDNQNRSGQPSL